LGNSRPDTLHKGLNAIVGLEAAKLGCHFWCRLQPQRDFLVPTDPYMLILAGDWIHFSVTEIAGQGHHCH
jgi:hypothetical protein